VAINRSLQQWPEDLIYDLDETLEPAPNLLPQADGIHAPIEQDLSRFTFERDIAA